MAFTQGSRAALQPWAVFRNRFAVQTAIPNLTWSFLFTKSCPRSYGASFSVRRRLRRFLSQTLHHVLQELVEGNFPFSVFFDERQCVPLVRLLVFDFERRGVAGYLLVPCLGHLLGFVILTDVL